MKIAKRLKHRFMWRIKCKWTYTYSIMSGEGGYIPPGVIESMANQLREEIDKEVINSFKTA